MAKDERTKNANWRVAARPGLLVTASAMGPAAGAALIAGPAIVHADWLAAGGVAVVVLLCLGATFGTGLALLPTHAMSLLMGFAMGVWAGPIAALLCVSLAAWLGYALAGLLAGDGLLRFARGHPRLAGWVALLAPPDDQRERSLVRIVGLVALIRLSPVMPFAATNVLLAALGVPVVGFLLGSVLGMMPRVLAVSMLGAGMAQLDFSKPTSVWLFVAGIVATVALLAAVGYLAGRPMARHAVDSMDASDRPDPVKSFTVRGMARQEE